VSIITKCKSGDINGKLKASVIKYKLNNFKFRPRIEEARGLNALSAGFFNPRETRLCEFNKQENSLF